MRTASGDAKWLSVISSWYREIGRFLSIRPYCRLLLNHTPSASASWSHHLRRRAASEESNALVTLRSGARAEPNTRATTVRLFDGLEATSQNSWPSLDFDLMAVNQLFAPIFVAGFYYKTFMCPRALAYVVARLTGLGARALLQRGMSIDLHPDAFSQGSVASTIIAHIGMMVWQVDDRPTYDVATFRSYFGSFRQWLDQAAAAL